MRIMSNPSVQSSRPFHEPDRRHGATVQRPLRKVVFIRGPRRDGEAAASVQIRRDLGTIFNNDDDKNNARASMDIEVEHCDSATANHQAAS